MILLNVILFSVQSQLATLHKRKVKLLYSKLTCCIPGTLWTRRSLRISITNLLICVQPIHTCSELKQLLFFLGRLSVI